MVQAVVQALGRGQAPGVQAQHLLGDEAAVETVGDQVDADGGNHDPDGADGFATLQCDDAEGGSAA